MNYLIRVGAHKRSTHVMLTPEGEAYSLMHLPQYSVRNKTRELQSSQPVTPNTHASHPQLPCPPRLGLILHLKPKTALLIMLPVVSSSNTKRIFHNFKFNFLKCHEVILFRWIVYAFLTHRQISGHLRGRARNTQLHHTPSCSPLPSVVTSSQQLSPLEPSYLFSITMVLSVRECHMKGMTQCVTF